MPPEAATDPARQVAFRFGITAESRAAAYLMAKGHRIVARRGRAFVFVEVKARHGFDAAAEAWLARTPDDVLCELRFDVVLVAPGRLPRHLMAAFDASQ